MSAAVLREAASLMRVRAEDAADTNVWRGDTSDVTSPDDGAFTHHVATFANPAVAIAVADWLDAEAEEVERIADGSPFGPGAEHFILGGSEPLAVAHAYLGQAVTQ